MYPGEGTPALAHLLKQQGMLKGLAVSGGFSSVPLNVSEMNWLIGGLSEESREAIRRFGETRTSRPSLSARRA